MRHYPSLEAYENSGLLGCMLKTLRYLKNEEEPTGRSNSSGASNAPCEVWVVGELDDDESVTSALGAPLAKIVFNRVSYHPDEERFTCLLPGGGILIVPDVYWLNEPWRDWLITQL